MRAPHSAPTQQTVFAFAVPTAIVTLGVAAALLAPSRPEASRLLASGGLLILTGAITGVCCASRARLTAGRRRRAWLLFTVAIVVAFLSNLAAGITGAPPGLFSDLAVVVALVLCIAGLLSFPGVRRSGTARVMSVLDGLVACGGMIAIASVLVVPQLVVSIRGIGSTQLMTTLLIPVLDLVLLTLALIMFVRASGTGRWSLLLMATGFGVYAVADLTYAMHVVEGGFSFGTRLDLGWILGYLFISLAALHPGAAADDSRSETPSDTRGAILVFAVLVVAGMVQVNQGEPLSGRPLAGLWLLLVVVTGIRLTMLSIVNDALRHGLERRVQAQTADLARLVAEKEQLLTSVGDGIYGVDREGRITFVNPSGAAALGLRPQDLLGRDAHATFHAGDDAHLWTECYVHRALHSASDVSEVEDTYGRAGGATFPVEVTANPVVELGETRGAVVVFRDVTQRREVEQMKNDFLSVVSHELRTPLTSIRGSLGLLAGGALGPLAPRVSSLVTVAAESSERLTRLIDDLLDMERNSAGGQALRFAALDAESVVRSAVEQMRGAGLPRDISVTVGRCTGRALADEDQVLQTLTNLLGNAIKFSEPGGRVVASAHAEDGHVVFRVRDEGRGIPSDKLALIFEPFAQVDSSDAREKDGTGLGLAICRNIVERHGGRIWAESRDRQGTTMLFTLPAAPRAAAVLERVV